MGGGIRCIAILAAMASELKPLCRALGLTRTPDSGAKVYSGDYRGVTVIAAVTNMGMAASQERAQALFAQYGSSIDHLFVVGIAGAFDPNLSIGELVVPLAVVDDRDGMDRFPVNLSNQPPSGTIYSSDRLRYEDDFVALLHQRRVSLVDMESGAIAAVCEEHGCPYTVIRAVSDRVDEHGRTFDVFYLAHPDGSPNFLAALRYILANPSKIPYLMAMLTGSRKAIAASTAELLRNIDRLLNVA